MSNCVDMDALQELRELMEDDFPSLIETYLTESVRQYQAVKSAWDQGNLDDLCRAAHTLKGSCGNVGAFDLHKTCADLEHLARDGEAERLPTLIQSVATQLDEVNAVIRTL